ncbi:hypothetical protein GXP67_04525 [Rhodocytophaga rosea]|uniref:FecR protein domain-containing protein n=1 Tax=Rhodocytophaga rosea TaxID=2704465 RepID=A0A6C0GDE0_9BACT|nr:hypothetical protein [Rhodocytophaga rosea]QHT65985.1 hypothetical protein GXP67_04525 [Rhodocytophaga rosea]
MRIKFIRNFLLMIMALYSQHAILNAQAVQTKEPNYRDPVLDRQANIIAEVKAKPEATQGTYYIDTEWHTGNIYLKSGDTLRNYPLKYDIDKNLIEINTPQNVKVLHGDKAVAFEWNTGTSTATFINGEYYKVDGTRLVGFFQVLVVGNFQLLSKTMLEVKKADYNVALDVGSRADKILKKERLFIARDKQLYEIKGKDDLTPFGDKAAAVKSYAKENKLKPNKREDAMKLVLYSNTI